MGMMVRNIAEKSFPISKIGSLVKKFSLPVLFLVKTRLSSKMMMSRLSRSRWVYVVSGRMSGLVGRIGGQQHK